ncbi:hypothetical protein Mal52_53850 [Symmachiella dynata]|uniref:Uncharacterized protein n=1 Tax=Symmachiella dynata TaxID=2527995 RepID=A0A517ZWI4_9PLAN|nr:hypothetical protein [Symmachiella dynata]QDU46862.1 hypothetical protein Mal52_53850 [Symmachiella dynata]
MWQITQNDLNLLRGAGGERFVHFVDMLIYATAAKFGVPYSAIKSQQRVNVPDGGVDTEVDESIPNDVFGWFATKTCWQFKAVDASAINNRTYKTKLNDLQSEVRKDHVQKLIGEGYAFRFCLLGDVTPRKATAWEETLKREVAAINSSAPPPRVVHGADLCKWASHFPAVAISLTSIGDDEILCWSAWQANCIALTAKYVPNKRWNEFRERIRQHVQFSNSCVGGKPCLPIGGVAGVGKTRLVFETLKEFPFAEGIIGYTANEAVAKTIAAKLTLDSENTAIIVADECSAEARAALDAMLIGHTSRIRLICVSNIVPGYRTQTPAIWLSGEDLTNTEEILATNFPSVPIDRRHRYAELSRGFVRLAADMCANDARISAGDITLAEETVEEYICDRIPGDVFGIVSLLALFSRVGFRDEFQSELQALCVIGDCKPQWFRDTMRSLKDAPGFVAEAGRYFYVTPEIVARVLFTAGWKKWVRDDIEGFWGSLPETLRDDLIERTAVLGSEEVRRESASFFRKWFLDLTVDDLSNSRVAEFAAAITEASPGEFLPFLREFLINGAPEAIDRIKGHTYGSEWGPRRTLVWLFENLVSFDEYFDDCESCLFRLAAFETEPEIGNNATAIWRSLFRITLSGTQRPFNYRLGVLARRLSGNDTNEFALACQGLAEIFTLESARAIGRSFVSGRMRPSDWFPANVDEERSCFRAAIRVCIETFRQAKPPKRDPVLSVLVRSTTTWLANGFLEETRKNLTANDFSDDERRVFVESVDGFLHRFDNDNPEARQYRSSVEEWIEPFRPRDFDGVLRSVCAREIWDERFKDDKNSTDEMADLADKIIKEPSKLEGHLEWLGSSEARSAEILGFRIGQIDANDLCARIILENAARTCAAPLARGYIRGIRAEERKPNDDCVSLVHGIEATCPETAADLLSFGGDDFDAIHRVEALAGRGALKPAYLNYFAMGVGGRELTPEEINRLLKLFVESPRADDDETARAGIRFIATRLSFEKIRNWDQCLENESTRGSAWTLLENSIEAVVGAHPSHEWADLARALSPFDPSRTANTCCEALLSDNHSLRRQAKTVLGGIAEGEHAEVVMISLGRALLNEERGWRLQVGVLRDIVASIPANVVLAWVEQEGLRGAKAIARHLPAPYIDDQGTPIVPKILDVILSDFPDESVLAAFAAGVHSHESWFGSASERFRQEAEDAKRFLDHSNPMIRKWAKSEFQDRLAMAEREDQDEAERFF